MASSNTNPDGNNWAPRNEGWGVLDHQRERINGQAVLQFKPVDSLVATADYTYTFYKDMNQTHTFGAWFDYGPNPISAIINPQGTVTNLVDTGSDDSYFASNDEIMNQNGSAGINLKWQASDNIAVELRRASLHGRFGRRRLGHEQLRHRRSDPAGDHVAQQVLYHGSRIPGGRSRVPESPRPRIKFRRRLGSTLRRTP